MSRRMLTEDLIESVKNRTLGPVSNQTYTDTEILSFLNEELGAFIVPEIEKVREDMWLRSKDLSILNGVSKIPLPERAAGESLKIVFYKDSNGNRFELSRLPVSRIDSFGASSSHPSGYFLQGSFLNLIPTPNSGGTLEVWYYQRPSELVFTSACGKITNITTTSGTTTLTVDTNLSGNLSVGSLVDIQSAKSPYFLWADDAEIQAITSSTVVLLTSSIDDEASNVLPVSGDYVCAAKTSNIAQIPQEFNVVLAQAVGCRILEGLGDMNKLQIAQENRDRMMANCLTLIQNRVESSVEYINNKFSFVNSKRRWFRGSRGPF